jgi:hypothetical protein
MIPEGVLVPRRVQSSTQKFMRAGHLPGQIDLRQTSFE